ncbi:hypothetical protein CYY_009247 [Polysphondylium violaceum]|uniref:Pulmonary surfactant-associated protein B n=1 Tax=Polysphondylium violaceum TaxID=133409 RepID=A0A8J4UW83_9MYCE|nr:hypothetical protein CYY_009247 [Polysphondylium violaceum]
MLSILGGCEAKGFGVDVDVAVGTVEECKLCTYFVGEIEGYLENNSTQEEIITYLNNYCDDFFGGVASTCEALVQQYVPLLFTMLANDEDSSVVCKQVHLCDGSSSSSNNSNDETIEKIIKSFVKLAQQREN